MTADEWDRLALAGRLVLTQGDDMQEHEWAALADLLRQARYQGGATTKGQWRNMLAALDAVGASDVADWLMDAAAEQEGV